MTERVRRRTSKWDLKEDPEKFPIGTRQDNASSGKGSESIHDNGSIQEWNVSKDSGSRNQKWSDKSSDSVFSSEGKPRRSRWEAPSGNRAEPRHDNLNRNFNGASETMRKWDENRSYSTSMSPGLDGWRQQSQSHSPKRGWSKSHRSRSRSPPHRLRSMSRSPSYHHRSRSRSPPQRFRSRSRSPLHGYKREPEWNDRIRGGLKASLCNDFARGRCRRGSQCRFLHQENNIIDDRRPSGSVPAENWESKRERGASYGHPDHVEWDHSKDKLAAGHDSQRNYKSSDSCINFLKGNCFRGSSCRFVHENSIIDGRGASERTHERDIKSYSGRDHRREPYRSNIPCKYFAAGNCRKGVSCTFSHEDAAHDRPDGAGTSADNRWGHGLDDENKSWGAPKWIEEGVDSAHGSAEGKSLNFGAGHIAKSAWDEQGWNKKPTWNNEQALDGRPEAGSADERWVHKLGDESKSLGGPTWSNEAEGRSEAKPADERWGNSLIDENKSWGGSEAKVGDQRWAHDLGNESKSWGGPKRDDAVGQTNTSVEGRSLNQGRDRRANSGWDDPRWTEQSIGPAQKDEAADSEVKKFPQWGNEDHAGLVGGPEEVKPIVGVKWPVNTTESVVTTSDWNNDRNDVGISVSQPFQGPVDNTPNYNMDTDNRTWGVQRWADKPSDQGGHKSPRWKTDNTSANMGLQLPGSNEEVLNFRSTASAGAERDQYAHSSDNGKSRFGIQAPQSRVQSGMYSHEQVSTQEISCQQPYPTVVTYPEGQKHPAPTVMIHPVVSSMNAQNQQIQEHPASLIMVPSAVSSMNAQNQQTPEHPASRVMVTPAASSMKAENEQTQEPPASRVMVPPAASSMNTQNQQTQTQEPPASRGMVPPAASSMNTQNQQTQEHLASRLMAPPAGSSMNAQNQQTLPSAGPRARTFDLNGPVEDLPSPNQKALFHMEETSKRAGRTDPRLSMPPINSGTSGAQNVVTSEQVAKISHLSASLAQIFGNSQQLPQLYATLNSTSSLGLVPPHPTSAGVGAPFVGSFMPPEQDAWSQKQYDPASRSMESSQISTRPQVFPEKNIAQHEPQTLLQTNVPSSLGVGPDGSDPAKKETLDHKSNELKRFETVGNEQAVVKEQETAHSGDPNADEDGKKSKDTKGMRMFKFALVEFVKEILKPTWKEGQLSKEAHKTVVKKVVDKVTGSVQGDHIPQTQERIDQYMAYSKTKLTKLVEAYVEKYVKT